MPSVIKFAPLSGAVNETATETPFCYLLEIDGYRILLDCGWFSDFDPKVHEPLGRVAGSINAVLLSHPDLAHLGALPYAFAKLGLNCKVYATLPVYNMGQMFLYDEILSRTKREDFDLFTLDDIDNAFDDKRWVILNSMQSIALPSFSGKPSGIKVAPFPAGHMVGGSIWRISKDTDDIIYAVSFNHVREHHLEGTVLQKTEFQKPSVLITDSNCMFVRPEYPRRQRDNDIFDSIMNSLARGGDVLIPCDSAGRVLEIALFLDQKWVTNVEIRRKGYHLAILNNVSFNAINYAQTMTEWMSERVKKSVESGVSNAAFRFKHLHLCHDLTDLSKVPSPRVVLASCETLENSFALDLFVQLAGVSKNTVILTSRGTPNSITRKLVDDPELTSFTTKLKRRVPLDGVELQEHDIRREKRRKEAQTESHRDIVPAANDEDTGNDSEEDRVQSHDSGKSLHESSISSGSQGYFKHARSYPMFAFVEPKFRFDDYGEAIVLQDFQKVADMTIDKMDVDQKGRVEEDTPQLTQAVDIPTKCVVQDVRVEIMCKIVYIDAQGLSDSNSVKNILSTVQPRKLIIINGTSSTSEQLRSLCKQSAVTDDIVVPSVKQVVDASSTTNLLQVKLTDSLVSGLSTSTTAEYELAYVEAIVKHDDDGSIILDAPTTKSQHIPIFVGEVMIKDLKPVLQAQGYHAEIIAGALLCNNEVAIRKNSTGQLTIEGPLSPSFFTIRKLVYQQYAIL